jgi:hypothetical protein
MDSRNPEVMIASKELLPFQVKQICEFFNRLESLIR